MKQRILISGAGVTGLTLAYWLNRLGMDVTVIERSAGFRRGGHAIDVRGVALEALKAMKLHEQASALRTLSKGMSILDAEGNEIRRTEERTFSAGRLDSKDLELFRDDLCQLLLDSLPNSAPIRYSESIQAITQDASCVTVNFATGAQERFEMIVGADGVYSHTRKLVFDEEAAVVKPLGAVLAFFGVPNSLRLEHWQLTHRADGVGYVMYPSREQDELRVGVGYGVEDNEVPRHDVAAQKALVAERCAGLRGFFPTIVDAMKETSQFYYNELAQIHMSRWSRGRVVLAGDAAHCASPFTGQGTSLALVGALILAHALSQQPNRPSEAFTAYEERMRPYVALNQSLPDLTREGPVADEEMDRAKNGIQLGEVISDVLSAKPPSGPSLSQTSDFIGP
jgi:2-polyprenyl-6-methoxyphenol hydroxylase-like FAD-dependent oxidoreductase